MILHRALWVALLLAASVGPACANRDLFVVDLVNNPASLDPQVQWDPDSYFVYRNVFDNLVSHDLAVVRHVCDRVAVMYLGRLAELAPGDALYTQPRHPYTKALLAAVPEPDPAVQRAKPRVPLTGEIPSAANPPSGCRFHTRCPIAIDICRHEVPAWRPVGHSQVACHLV